MRISDWSSDVCSSDLDAKDLVYVRIDRRRKLPATTLLLALDSAATEKLRAERAAEGKALEPHEAQGMTPEDVLDFFYDKITYKRSGNGWATPFDADRMRGVKLAQDLIDAKTGEAVAEAGQTITPRLAKKLVEIGR